ncbi:hypothetical protein CYY_004301 [Polysphondylium violaceum]|uniref:FHA domain-containing protein n=1 Tax=Polysphondylium violaceum TaxID=133409 RepID=A0A8J4PWG0_9MYCE|nr:hypothetical protein CYY_004301 [Polysphondylium violaceum]
MSVFDKYSEFSAFLVYSHLPALPVEYPPFIYLSKSLITIGRIRENDVKIDGLSVKHMVSRTHTRIQQIKNRDGTIDYSIEDQSMNGTFINGVNLEQKKLLVHNDRIRLGPTMSEIRYTFKRLDILSEENKEIFEYIRSLDIDRLKADPLSRLFTPIYFIKVNKRSKSPAELTSTTSLLSKRKIDDQEQEERGEEKEEPKITATKTKRPKKTEDIAKTSKKKTKEKDVEMPDKASASEEEEEEEEEEDFLQQTTTRKTTKTTRPKTTATSTTASTNIVKKRLPILKAKQPTSDSNKNNNKTSTASTTSTTATTTSSIVENSEEEPDTNDSDFDASIHQRKRKKDDRETVLYKCNSSESSRYGAWIVGKVVSISKSGSYTIEGSKKKIMPDIASSKLRAKPTRMSRKFVTEKCIIFRQNAYYEAKIVDSKINHKGDSYHIEFLKIDGRQPFENQWVHADDVFRLLPVPK